MKRQFFDVMICLSAKDEFVGAYLKKLGTNAKLHKRIDYKERGTIFRDYARNGKLIGTTFLNPNDFWRFMKILVTKKDKKNAVRN